MTRSPAIGFKVDGYCRCGIHSGLWIEALIPYGAGGLFLPGGTTTLVYNWLAGYFEPQK